VSSAEKHSPQYAAGSTTAAPLGVSEDDDDDDDDEQTEDDARADGGVDTEKDKPETTTGGAASSSATTTPPPNTEDDAAPPAWRKQLVRSTFVSLGAAPLDAREAFRALVLECSPRARRQFAALVVSSRMLGAAHSNPPSVTGDHAEALHAARAVDALRDVDDAMDAILTRPHDALNDRLAEENALVAEAFRAWTPDEPFSANPRTSRRAPRRAGSSLLSYPYLLDAASKARLLQAESRATMARAYHAELDRRRRHALFDADEPASSSARAGDGGTSASSSSSSGADTASSASSSAGAAASDGGGAASGDSSSSGDHPPSSSAGPTTPTTTTRASTTGGAASAGRSSSGARTPRSPRALHFVVPVRRTHLVEDAKERIVRLADDEDLRKQLKVVFKGEDGVDEGGVANEFMQLATSAVLAPEAGYFVADDESRALWFARRAPPASSSDDERHSATTSEEVDAELIGILLGIAAHNSILVDAPFAKFLWRKLLDRAAAPTLDDLDDAAPAVARSLRAIARAAATDAAAFERDFGPDAGISWTVEYDAVASSAAASKKSGDAAQHCAVRLRGAPADTERVAAADADRYVEAYVAWWFGESRESRAFVRGFDRVLSRASSDVYGLLTPSDLELLVRGSPSLAIFGALKERAVYEDGYDAESATVVNFWKVVDELDGEKKLKLLKFITGSDRAPIKGAPRIVISRSAATHQLPSSHTCFAHLVLPDYADLATLRTKLLIAIAESSEGFGLR